MARTHRFGVGLMALALFVSGCYGPFNLTRRLYRWNGQASSEKWGKEVTFLLLAVLPVYEFAGLADAIVFNSLEFWTGNNPVNPPEASMRKGALPSTKRIARGEDEAVLTYTPTSAGAELLVQHFRQGQTAGSLKIQQHDGVTSGYDAEGKLLFTSQAMPDGGVVVHDAQGKQVALYSAEQVEQFHKSVRQ